MNAVQIGPSILSADFLRLGEQLREAEEGGADFIHFDVMDGRFVPNISIGLPVLKAVRRGTKLPIDVHLMIVEPDDYVEQFVAAGANTVTIHVEATPHLHRALQAIAQAGARPSLSLNPATPLTAIEQAVPFVGQVLLMTVNPGFGGQRFIPEMLDKIGRLRRLLDDRAPSCRLEIDGGVTTETIGPAVKAGADTIVAGSAVYGGKHPVKDALAALRSALP